VTTLINAFHRGAADSEPVINASTVAFGITVPKALGDFLILQALYRTEGTAVAVTDEELLAAQATVAQAEGAFVCPEGAACFAAVRRLRDRGWLTGHEQVVVLNTGTGIKYPHTVPGGPAGVP
jgi:threonine synthase